MASGTRSHNVQMNNDNDNDDVSFQDNRQGELMDILAQLGAGIVSIQQQQAHQQVQPQVQPSTSSKLKIDIPTFSASTEEDLDQWVLYMEFIFEAKQLQDPETIHTAATGLRKEAANWYFALQLDANTKVTTWNEFKQEIAKTFGHPQAHDYYLNKIITIRQGLKTIQSYTSEFSCLAAKMSQMTDLDKMTLYIRGLRLATQVEVKCKMPKTLQEAKEIAVILETTKTAIYTDKKPEWNRRTFNKSSFQSNANSNSFNNQHRSVQGSSNSSHNSAVSSRSFNRRPNSQSNTYQKKWKWTPEGKIICYKCHKVGHKGADCKSDTASQKTLN